MKEDTIELKHYEPNSIIFNSPSDTILTIKPTGEIIWNSPTGEIVIDDKEVLAIAFMDIVSNLSDKDYDLSLLDKDLYGKYQEFLDSAQ